MARKHKEIIAAWADGVEVQILLSGRWFDSESPNFQDNFEYRIKPTTEKWYNIIPDEGIYCWLSDEDDQERERERERERDRIGLIISYSVLNTY
jgi:hypothetical protein